MTTYGQSASATYTEGDIPTDRDFTSLPGASTCPGTLTVTIPAGAIITSVDVEYDMTAANSAWLSEQRSQLRCVSQGGTNEAALSTGSGNVVGTFSYLEPGLTLLTVLSGAATSSLNSMLVGPGVEMAVQLIIIRLIMKPGK